MSIRKHATAEILLVEDEIPRAEVIEEYLTRIGHRSAVDRSISWSKDTPVTLDYKGKSPDIGGYEMR